MSLTTYNQKRKFSATPEPKGAKAKAAKKQLIFVIQRHKASRLHYDLRLELEGVLKSWAVPKGPSLNPADKRLAMMVEDHPFEYKDFAGVIPEGNYGAGIVEIWDSGTLSDLEENNAAISEKNMLAGLKAGNLKFRLKGKKLQGEFALVKLKAKEDNAWLLIKHRDEFAIDDDYDSETFTPKNSPVNKWLAEQEKPKKKAVKVPKAVTIQQSADRKISDFIPAMLAKETKDAFDGKDWLFEIKWDGYRAIAELNNNAVQLYSRNGNSFEQAYPVIFAAFKKLKLSAVLDGEIVVFNEEGNPDFQKLQHYAENTHLPIQYYAFDLLELNAEKLYDKPLVERKKLLQQLLSANEVIRYSDHVEERGVDFFNAIQQKNLEGIMAKQMQSRYYPGKRTGNWLKIKHNNSDEAIIVGFTQPRGGRKYFGALILAVQKNGELLYAGHTGSGFNDDLLKELSQKFQPLIREQSPFSEKIKTNMPVTWIEPKYVAEIKFAEWTKDGKMRHPIFMRMREDKSVTDLLNENPEPATMKKTAIKKAGSSTKKKVAPAEKKLAARTAAKPNSTKAANGDVIENVNEKTYTVGKAILKTTNRTKLFFPDDGITKGDVIDYYDRMADIILPYLKDRPESLFRTPNGINAKGFFHKDAGDVAPSWVKSIKIHSDSTQKEIDYLLCNNKATLMYMANLGCIEINPWHSTIKNLDNPDYMMVDIDPSDNNTFEQVIEAAKVVKEILDRAGASSFCKTSGASGLHIYVPTGKKYTFEQVKDFAYLVCMLANEIIPEITTLERSLGKRSKDKIYMDYLQNRRGQTIASVYSLRPKPGAPVSTPLLWQEVKNGLHPRDFNIYNIGERIAEKGDLFSGIFSKPIDLKTCLEKLS
jgi:bifunctional non-homologous end joining protein LigD